MVGAIEASVRALQIGGEGKEKGDGGMVDLWYLHGPDRTVTLEEVCKAVNEMYQEGRFRRWGLSNFSEFFFFSTFSAVVGSRTLGPVRFVEVFSPPLFLISFFFNNDDYFGSRPLHSLLQRWITSLLAFPILAFPHPSISAPLSTLENKPPSSIYSPPN